VPPTPACAAVSRRAPCGQVWDTIDSCTNKGCCWDSTGDASIPCFYEANAVNITYVHVIQSCHFDAGFADGTVQILNRWFTQFFPAAATIGAELAAKGGGLGLRFMAQSWIVSLYVDCPPGAGLDCPDAAALAQFSDSVAKGYIYWHAYPFNGELELHTPSMLDYAFNLTFSLDEQFGLPHKQVLSQRDVPGTTRAALPRLAANGIGAITVGVNGGSTPPNVPRAFVWRDPVSKVSLPVMWHPRGYGGISFEDAVILPGGSHAVIFDWEGDNAGPPSALQVIADFAALAKTFPGATIAPSTLDEFLPYLEAAMPLLPVIENEIADTWMHGGGSEPQKVRIRDIA
jgi:hypothetical protein